MCTQKICLFAFMLIFTICTMCFKFVSAPRIRACPPNAPHRPPSSLNLTHEQIWSAFGSGVTACCALIHVNYMHAKCACKSVWQHFFFFFFWVSMNSMWARVLSLVNYTRWYGRKRERGWDGLRRWVWSRWWLSLNLQSFLPLLALLVWRLLNACQKT